MKCIACGADIEFNPKAKKLKCSYCGSEFEAREYREKITAAKEIKDEFEEINGETLEAKQYACKQCGAKLLTFDDTAITFCSYCASSNVIESEIYKGEAPAYVIPFKITKEQCEEIYKKEIRKHIFAPKEMQEEVVIKKFRGIYMPYGVYKATHTGLATNYGEKYSHRSGNYDYYDNYTIRATVEAEYDGMAYDLSSSFYDKYSNAIAPYNFQEAEPFNINYLSGYYADSRDVKKNVYESDAKQIIKPDTTKELLKYKEFKKNGCSAPTLSYNIEDKKIAYYPVYFLAVRNKKNDAVNYAVVNGQTGKIAVELPIDIKKYLIFSLLLAIPIFIIMYALMTLTPQMSLIISVVLAVINMVIILKQNSKLKLRAKHADDKGYMDAQKRLNNAGEKIKKMIHVDNNLTPTITRMIIAIVIEIMTLIRNPINDIYYYIAGTIGLVIIILSFKEIIEQFNQLTSRKLSQIGIRGGDESEI